MPYCWCPEVHKLINQNGHIQERTSQTLFVERYGHGQNTACDRGAQENNEPILGAYY
jgi:hypothetical protein